MSTDTDSKIYAIYLWTLFAKNTRLRCNSQIEFYFLKNRPQEMEDAGWKEKSVSTFRF